MRCVITIKLRKNEACTVISTFEHGLASFSHIYATVFDLYTTEIVA